MQATPPAHGVEARDLDGSTRARPGGVPRLF